MALFNPWHACNSRAITKFHNPELCHFWHNTFIRELIRGSLIFISGTACLLANEDHMQVTRTMRAVLDRLLDIGGL